MSTISTFFNKFYSFKELRILTIALFVVSASALFFTNYLFNNYTVTQIQQTQEISTKIAESLQYYIEGIVHKSDNKMQTAEIILLNSSKNIDPRHFSAQLQELLEDTPESEIMTFSDENGKIIYNSAWSKSLETFLAQKNTNYQDRKYFQTLRDDPSQKIVISEPITSKTTGNKVIVISRRRYDPNQKFKGIIVTTVRIDKISKLLENINPVPGSTLALYMSNNILIARYPHVEAAIGKEIPLVEEIKPYLSQKRTIASFQGYCPIDKIDKVYGLAKIENFGMRALWGKPVEMILSKLNFEYQVTLAIEFIFLLICFAFLILYSQKLIQTAAFHESELASAQLVSLGEVAGSIAHEINNPISVIIGKTEILLRKIDTQKPEVLKIELEKIKTTAYKVSQIVLGIKKLSHHGESEALEMVQLRHSIKEIQTVIDPQLKKNQIQLSIEIDEKIEITGRAHQLGQVLLNLFTNSIYAIKDQESPWIKISGVISKNQFILSFVDSGSGIPKDIQSKILNPYFTTKSAQHGTGLGLSISKKIISSFGGNFELDTQAKNTTFKITLNLKS